MQNFACSVEYFPLTLTLSLTERGEQALDLCLANGRSANSGTGTIERLWIILLLPKGEGWGEGEPRVTLSRSLIRKAKGRCPEQAEPKQNG
jgi:hypothetical protein